MGKVGEIEAKAAWARWVKTVPCFGGQSCMDKVDEI